MSTTLDNYNKLQEFMAKQNGTVYTAAKSWDEMVPPKTSTPMQQTIQAPKAYDPAADIERLKTMQKQQVIGQLSRSRDNALSNLNSERATIAPTYYNKRNAEATGSQLQAKNFAEFMANRGSVNSGTNAQAEIARNVGLQGNVGALNQQEAQAYTDVARRESDINNGYLNDLNSANAGIEANATNQLIAANQQAYQNALNQYNTDRNFGYQQGRDSVLDNRYNQQFGYQMDRDNITDTRYNQQFNYQQGQDAISNKLRQSQFDFQKEQQAIDNTYRKDSFEWQKATAEAEQKFKENQAAIQQGQWQQSFNSDNYWKQKSYDYNASQDTQNRALKLAELESSSMKKVQSDYDDALNYGKTLINSTIEDSLGNKTKQYSTEQLYNWIANLDLPGEYKAKLANTLGIQKPNSITASGSVNPYYDDGGYRTYSGSR